MACIIEQGWYLGPLLIVGAWEEALSSDHIKEKESKKKTSTYSSGMVASIFVVRGWGCRRHVTLGLEVAVVALSREAGPGTGHHRAKLASFLLSLGKAENVLITLKSLGPLSLCCWVWLG